MTPRLLLVVLLAAFRVGPSAAATAAVRDILMDGNSSDFAGDEQLFFAEEEQEFDSWWGENNDINQVKLSWDSRQLYVAVDGRCWDNGILLFLDTDSLRGIADQDLLNTWARKIKFEDRQPEFFLGAWDRGTWPDAPQLWELDPGATLTVHQKSQNTDYSGASTFSQGQTGAAMEAAVPWTTLYPGVEEGSLPAGAELALVAVLVTGSDHKSGPDCAPNNILGMPQNAGDFALIDNFAIFRLDRDGDGEPDLGVSPASREGDAISDLAPLRFIQAPDTPPEELRFLELKVLRDAFSPNGDGIEDEAELTFTLSASREVKVSVHDLRGRLIRVIEQRDVPGHEAHAVAWDGKDLEGRSQEAGVYFMRIDTGYLETEIIPVAVLR